MDSAPNFLEQIFRQLQQVPDRVVLQQLWEGQAVSVTGRELLTDVAKARAFLQKTGLKKGDRSVLLAPNSIRWVALDLAMMAEGLIVVPMYSRQAPHELAAMMKDCSPALICCSTSALADPIRQNWPDAPPVATFDEIFVHTADISTLSSPLLLAENDPVTIIYTSGTSGEAKGVVLSASNVTYMLSCTSGRLDLLMNGSRGHDRVFQYLPFCFAASWIMLLTCLVRGSLVMLATDLNRLAVEMRSSAPHYFLNVPVLLERMRSAVDQQFAQIGGFIQMMYENAKQAWFRRQRGERGLFDWWWLLEARLMVFPNIRRKMIGKNLKALICGSAPLARDTQLFFSMIGIPVLQAYGLTETTGICTLDDPRHFEPGRVGQAIPGIEMKLAENSEILVRGPNIFPGYWNRPQATAEAKRDGWFHTGDQGEVNEAGNWRILGRVKNLIVLSSGHNVAPEPIEDSLLRLLPDAQQVVLVGHGRSFLAALVTGNPGPDSVQFAIDEVNRELPHYKRLRAFEILNEPFSVENGMLTVNGKLKRDSIAARFQPQIDALYGRLQTA